MSKRLYVTDKELTAQLPEEWEIGVSHGINKGTLGLPSYQKYPVLFNGQKNIFIVLTSSSDNSTIKLDSFTEKDAEETYKILSSLPDAVKKAWIQKVADWRKISTQQAGKQLDALVGNLLESPGTAFDSARTFVINDEAFQVIPEIAVMPPAGIVLTSRITHCTPDTYTSYHFPIVADKNGDADDLFILDGRSPGDFPHPVRAALASLTMEIADKTQMPVPPESDLKDTIASLLHPSEEEMEHPASCVATHVDSVLLRCPPLFAESYKAITDPVSGQSWSVSVETLPVLISDPEASEPQYYMHALCVMAMNNETGERYYIKERELQPKSSYREGEENPYLVAGMGLVKLGEKENEELSLGTFNSTVPSCVRKAMLDSYSNSFQSFDIAPDVKMQLGELNTKEQEARASHPEMFTDEAISDATAQKASSFSQRIRRKATDMVQEKLARR